MDPSESPLERFIDSGALIVIVAVFFVYFEPALIFSKTITTGGDTATHYYTLHYLKEKLLPHGAFDGWVPGHFAGFRLFQLYFPLPFLLMAFLGYLIPLQVAFKLGTILGTVITPLSAYLCLRWMKYAFPIPIFGALSTLPFLFMESNTMWGGNIPSTLAGEFCYSLGLALTLLLIGSLHLGIATGRRVVFNALLIASIGMTHGYTLLFSLAISVFFLLKREGFLKKGLYLFKIYALGFFLMGIWIVPLLTDLPFSTRYNITGSMKSILELFPVILMPLLTVAVLSGIAGIWTLIRNSLRERSALMENRVFRFIPSYSHDSRIAYLWFGVAASVAFYMVASKIHVVDFRFFPFLQLLLMMIGAVELGRTARSVSARWLLPVIGLILTVIWINLFIDFTPDWIHSNYAGFEEKPRWSDFDAVNRALTGTGSDPRVVSEYSELNEDIGTFLAFELIPLFSGRSTLEGLYFPSSITSPFVYYIETEISSEGTCPIPDYPCTWLRLGDGIRHLRMFNVRDFIIRGDAVKNEIRKHPDFVLKKSIGPFQIYELSSNENRYVVPLSYEPVLYETENWKRTAYDWFRRPDLIDVHLVPTHAVKPDDRLRFKQVIQGGGLEALPKIPIDPPCQVFREEIKPEEIVIQSDCIGRPVLIKVSYHPKWKADGADQIYLASPSFMMIFPNREVVTLRFSRTWDDWLGLTLSTAGLILLAAHLPFWRENRIRSAYQTGLEAMIQACANRIRTGRFTAHLYSAIERNKDRLFRWILTLVIAVFLGYIFLFQEPDPNRLFSKALDLNNKQNYSKARSLFEVIVKDFPTTNAANDSRYYSALTYFDEGKNQKALDLLQGMITEFPDSNWVPEAFYYIGLCHANLGHPERAGEVYRMVMDRFPGTKPAKLAAEQLTESKGP